MTDFIYIQPQKSGSVSCTNLEDTVRFQFFERKVGKLALKICIGNYWLKQLSAEEKDTIAIAFSQTNPQQIILKKLPRQWTLCTNKNVKKSSFSFILVRWAAAPPKEYADSKIRRMKNVELYDGYLRMEFPSTEDEEYKD